MTEHVTISVSADLKRKLTRMQENRPGNVSYNTLIEELVARYGDEIEDEMQIYGVKTTE